MSDIIKSYTALSSSSSRTDVSNVFNSIINAPHFTFDRESRVELIKAILQDVKSYGSKGKLTSKDIAQALLAVKTLGKDPAGSTYLSTNANLSTLLGLAATFKDDPEASSEALRCIANALLLIEGARSTFIGSEVNGGDSCLTMLEKTTSLDSIFILSRILFLATAAGTSYIETIIERKFHGRSVVEILGSKLELTTESVRSGTPMAKDACTDLLKFIFNLLLHYPRLVDAEPQHSGVPDGETVIGDLWSPKLDGLLPPLLKTFVNLPPTSPCPIAAPLTHVIHSLITIPINSSLKPIWLGLTTTTSNSPKSRTPRESASASRSDSPTRPSTSPTSPKPSTLERAISGIAAARRSLSSRGSSPTTTTPSIDVLQRAYDLLEQGLSRYFPGDTDVDDSSVRAKCKAESTDTIDDMMSPLAVLITRLCIGDEGSKARMRQWLVPDDLDRTSPLEMRQDTLGRCLRLLATVYHPRLKDAVGEMLFAIADLNPSTLTALVGYGNVAGFLFHKGILSQPPPADSSSTGVPSTTPDGASIDPVTGIVQRPKPDVPEMSEDEKEREMEKLFVLFDRLERTGALPPDKNPIRKAIQSGKMG